MRDEADGGYFLLDIRGEGGIEITLLVEFHVLQSFTLEFLFQILSEDKLFWGTWHALAVFRGLRVELGVIQKPFSNIHLLILNSQF